ncbi:MAG: hypothetical protein R3F21_02325 [Myxococcota bacterium]
MGGLAFLWHESDGWHAQRPLGPTGIGASRDDALADLRAALHDPQRSSDREPVSEVSLVPGRVEQQAPEQARRERTRSIDDLDIEQCLLISPDAFESMLAQQCPLATHFPTGPAFSQHAVGALYDWPIGSSFFRRSRILQVSSTRYALEFRSSWLPVGFGVFAFDGNRLLALHRRTENLRVVLSAEQRRLDEADPEDMARFLAGNLGDDGMLRHDLVTLDSLHQMEASGEYLLDPHELWRIASALAPASIEAHAGGWTVGFASLFGWSVEKQVVVDWRIDVSRRFEVTARKRIVSERIFRSTPIVME